ncbi:16S rRNA (adenine1518-N6/adenine1519-N6)-dimethyltransferase [Ruminococcus sp. YE71]|uniref:16S rRNA (adenine(1518)-N(6)/adenine(1519)-N(6))- dimethyltransferase RsmA n=1 Tax=unclassified Ruminococcus TaxID=2608920 RepID=UPI0008820B01|nr:MULTISPECIES: 16S rRNA (adenine(1518)-N(6)/adenine(1519)-N(6))-dimethyltransferase RsmA [unclassified Ruminococcus]SDA27222.1 16S rRNA (adenine1518-N6/adenine1519-N6)-dimethyltransferase [Ruminococcus sp. YE78]SFW45381.1 16S rRNA (adenine1518-N6/adenine1519-N6)-dimethyltransferase [Ruminococcus sp. YE71]
MEGLYEVRTINRLLEKYGFSFSKKLGQNFLINPSVCPRIAEMGNAQKGFGVIEVGTGFGVLTHELAKRADKVCAVELDERLIPVLEETLAEHDNVKIFNADIMEFDLHKLIAEEFEGLEVVVCANLPYYITSPVIMRLLEERLPIRSVTVMVQKEAGVRLCAPLATRDCGAVTFAVRYFSEPKQLFNVSRGSFYPAPNVDSCVIRFDIRGETPDCVTDEKHFFKVVRAAFQQRRKTLCNSVSGTLGLDKSLVGEAAAAAGLSPSVRPEAMSLEQMAAFSEELKKLCEK